MKTGLVVAVSLATGLAPAAVPAAVTTSVTVPTAAARLVPTRDLGPCCVRSVRWTVAGWLLAGFGMWMAFGTATTTDDSTLRIAMLVVIGVLGAGVLIDATRLALQRRRAPRE
ncbi:hypothetical protein [Microbacterium paraoxydans]|uniref:hypothetical protein n=1 Tax=Microbacterium paraoxydans TaxID=199592 RepID=UPI003D7568D8